LSFSEGRPSGPIKRRLTVGGIKPMNTAKLLKAKEGYLDLSYDLFQADAKSPKHYPPSTIDVLHLLKDQDAY
jgi:hypothetical protein